MPRIASVGTAVPPHRITQQETSRVVRQLFGRSFVDIDRLLTVFETAQIKSRHLCAPLEWFQEPHTFAEKNKLYIDNAIRLSAEAITRCLVQAGLTPQDIDHLVFVSTTGLSTPSIDAHLCNVLNLRTDIKRTPVWGLGCAGGTAGLARGYDLARAHPNERIVICCVELCGLTFMHEDRSKSNLIATSLFADGAAAALVLGDDAVSSVTSPGPEMLGSQSMLWPDTLDVMGWELQDAGLKVIFSRDIPTIVQQKIPPKIDEFCQRLNVPRDRLTRFIAHPGGLKVLLAYESALGLSSEQLLHARDVLNEYGNMSSCTVLFVLERELREAHQPGEHGIVLALGPGFSCEQVMLRW